MKGSQSGMGMRKHHVSGHAGKSPRLRFMTKLEAERNERKKKGIIKEPASSMRELLKRRP